MNDQQPHGMAAVAERLSDEVPGLLVEHDIPGMAVGICHRSGVTWSAGFGVTARGGQDPVTSRTMFGIQSISKMYTATSVLLAVQQNLLDLHAPVTEYLPEFTVRSRWESAPEQRMTLEHLLSHRSGLTHEAPLGSNIDDRDTSFEEHCRSISDTWLRFPVGHHYEYSNLGYDLAAYIIQRTCGFDFAAFVRRELLEPLGLHRTTFDHEEIARDLDRAVGHLSIADAIPVRVPMVGAGGAYSSVDDSLRYLQFHLAGGQWLLRKESLNRIYEVPDPLPGQRFGYGLGVAVTHWNGRRVLSHGGGGFGFLSDLAWDPAAGFGVAVLTNSEDHPLQVRLASSILRDLAGSDSSAPDLPPPVVLNVGALDSMVGEYVGRGGNVATIVRDGTRLVLERDGTTHGLRAVGPSEVVAEDKPRWRFRLRTHDHGPGHAYLVSVEDGYTFYRNDPPNLANDASSHSYTVDYLGSPAATLRMRRRGDHATLEGEGLLAFPPLQLSERAPGLYFSSTGEVLDLTTNRPTYANIPLMIDRT